MNKISPTPFYFVRHGQTDWNVEKRLQGLTDIPLNETGKQQAESTALFLSSISFASIFHSPLMRAKETALIISAYQQATVHELHDLKERHFGSGEGKIKPADFNFGKSLPEEFFIGAEENHLFNNRVSQAVGHALKHQGPICIVAHGGVYGALCLTLGIDQNSIENAAIVQFVPKENQWAMIKINHPDDFI